MTIELHTLTLLYGISLDMTEASLDSSVDSSTGDRRRTLRVYTMQEYREYIGYTF